jgi:hypothetical protein
VVKRLLLAAALSFATGSALAGPSARCHAMQQGRRTLATVEVKQFFDRELLRLIRLGLAGKMRVTLVLIRRRALWFDDEVMDVVRVVAVTWDKQRRIYLLDGNPVEPAALDALTLDRVSLGRREANTAGSHYVEVNVQLEVVTASSLLAAGRWLSGKSDGGDDVIATQLARAVAADLTRSESASCDVR